MIRRLFVIFVLIVAVVLPVNAEESNGGYTGSFLQMPVGARPVAMGGAYRSISNDGAGPLYNPAGVAELKKIMFASSYRMMELDRKLGYVNLLFPARLNSVIGISWLYAGSGAVDGRNKDGDLTGTDYSLNNHDIGIVFAKRFENLFAAGVKLNYLQSDFGNLTAFSVGFDFGFLFYLSELVDRENRDLKAVQNIQLGFTLKNIAAKYRWDTGDMNSGAIGIIQEDDFPLEVAVGGSARFFDKKLLLSSDLVYTENQSIRNYSGAEYFVKPEFALRAGFSDGRATAGTGYVFKLGKRIMAIDYAFSTDKASEGSEHIFSFDLLF